MMSKVNNIAHRLVPLCLLLVALAGCRKEDTPAPDTPSGTPIAFTPETATKAAVSGVEDIQNDPNGFRVWSWFQGTTSGPMFGADGTQVTYEYDTTLETYVWTYSPTRYWMNGNYDFAAIYPAAITTGEGEAATTTAIAGTYAPATTGGTPVLTVPNFDATTQADLLVAFNNGTDGTGINGATPPDAVHLTFQHALSLIQLELSLDPTDFYRPTETGTEQIGYAFVSESGFYNIPTKMRLYATSYDDMKWTSLAVSDYNIIFEDALEVDKAEYFLGEDGTLVMPQLLDDNIQLYFKVSILFPGISDRPITKDYNIQLNTLTTKEWLPGKKYKYTGTIYQDFTIDFSVVRVNNWIDDTLGGVIIN